MTQEEYVSVDNQLATDELMSDEQIIAMVINTGESGEEAGEEENDPTADDSPEAVCITHSQAAEAVDLLMRYFEQSDIATPEDIQPLSAIKRRVDYMRYSAQKQPLYRIFFDVVLIDWVRRTDYCE